MTDSSGSSKAYLLGRIVQAIVLAAAVIAILLKLLQQSELSFRYGGF